MRVRLILALCSASFGAVPSLAQQSVADQTDQLALETAQQALDAARQKQLLDALAAVKQPTEGKATLTDPAATAEGLMLVDHGLRTAAGRLADKVATWRGQHTTAKLPLVVVMGAQAPSIAQWQSFDRMVSELKTKLELVVKDWNTVTEGGAVKVPVDDGGGNTLHQFMGALPVLAIVSTVASLLKTDYGITGSKVGPPSDTMRAIIVNSLSANSVAQPELVVAIEPSGVKSRLDELKPLREAAAALYHDKYLKVLAAAGGKPDKLDPAVAAAGANLATVLSDYDGLVKSLYSPVGSVLPAVEVERQRLLADAKATQPILYVTSYSSNLSAVTKKGFLSGIRTTPASLRVAVTIDYAIAAGAEVTTGHVVFDTPQIPFDEVTFDGQQQKTPKRQ